jgi:hypothetical protein
VSKRDDDLRTAPLRAQVLDDLRTQLSSGFSGKKRDPLRVEEDHSGPADAFAAAVARREIHHEHVAFVIEKVPGILELGQRLPAEGLQELEMLLSPLEGLLHRDDAVAKHPCLRHRSPES